MARPIKSKWFQPDTIVNVEFLRNTMLTSFKTIGHIIGCSRQVARYIYITKCKQERVETKASYHVERVVYCPSVAYVKGLEEYKNPRYRMVHSNENAIHPLADNA